MSMMHLIAFALLPDYWQIIAFVSALCVFLLDGRDHTLKRKLRSKNHMKQNEQKMGETIKDASTQTDVQITSETKQTLKSYNH